MTGAGAAQRQRSQRVAFDKEPADAPTDVMANETGKTVVHKTKYPKSRWLQVDTSESIELNVEQSLAYLKGLMTDTRLIKERAGQIKR